MFLEISDETRKFDITSLPETERNFLGAEWIDLEGCMSFLGQNSSQLKYRMVNGSDGQDMGPVVRFFDARKGN